MSQFFFDKSVMLRNVFFLSSHNIADLFDSELTEGHNDASGCQKVAIINFPPNARSSLHQWHKPVRMDSGMNAMFSDSILNPLVLLEA
jgi:hypothetical protein